MTTRCLALFAAAALAAAVPATAVAKPHGSGHPGKGKGSGHGKLDRSDRGTSDRGGRVSGLADGDVAPITEESPVEGTPAEKPAKTRGRGRGKGKMTVFKGRVVSADAATGTVVVRVRQRNRWARVWRGEEVTFTLDGARIQVADVDGDGTHGVSDVAAGDRVVVKARVARGAADDGTPIAALRLIDQSSPSDEADVVEPDPVATEPAPVETEEPAPILTEEPAPVETVPEV